MIQFSLWEFKKFKVKLLDANIKHLPFTLISAFYINKNVYFASKKKV